MRIVNKRGIGRLAFVMVLAASAISAGAQDLSSPVCDVVIYDEQTELEDARNNVDLAKSDFAAYVRIFEMIEQLWKSGTVPQMDYIKAKYDRDAARLKLEKADLILDRQSALVEQYRLICKAGSEIANPERARAIRKAYLRYRRADCDSLIKAIDVAATNLEYNREYLKRILKLRQENNATHTQIILAELDVELEEKNLADAKRRTAICRSELVGLESDPGVSSTNSKR
jgi:outer membrane protein TolC